MNKRWSDEEVVLLLKVYEKPYAELVKVFPGRSVRSLKHKIGQLGLQRSERRVWSDEEKDLLKKYPEKSAKELASLVKRNEVQVAHQLRKIRGSANRRFKVCWKRKSSDLAYFIGAIASDIGVYEYTIELVQKLTNGEMCEKVISVVKNVFGFSMKKSSVVVDEVEYTRLWCCSTEFLRLMGTAEGIVCKNIRGEHGEWIDFIEENFSWVFDDEYFWDFVGGWYDGDGSLVRRRNGYRLVKIGVKPKRSRIRMIEELKKRGFDFVEESCQGEVSQIVLKGGVDEVRRFVEMVNAQISRKVRV